MHAVDQEEVSGTEGHVEKALAHEIQQRRGQGRPLPAHVRRTAESALDSNFDRVRIHTDERADGLAQNLQAKAFTIGNDIFFKNGNYNPSCLEGRKLLGHELVHTIQQHGVTGKPQRVGDPNDAIESEAAEVGRAVASLLGGSHSSDTDLYDRSLDSSISTRTEDPVGDYSDADPSAKDLASGNTQAVINDNSLTIRRAFDSPVTNSWGIEFQGRWTVETGGQTQVHELNKAASEVELPAESSGKIHLELKANRYHIQTGGLLEGRRSDLGQLPDQYSATWEFTSRNDNFEVSFVEDRPRLSSLSSSANSFEPGSSGHRAEVRYNYHAEQWFSADLRASKNLSLRLKPRAEPVEYTVEIGPISVQKIKEIGPFPVGSAELTSQQHRQIREFYNSLSVSTREAIRNNERPAGLPVVIEGYASTTGSIRDNDQLALERARAVKDLIQDISGNQQEEIFVTPSEGEFQSPAGATDISTEETEDPQYRKAIIKVFDEP